MIHTNFLCKRAAYKTARTTLIFLLAATGVYAEPIPPAQAVQKAAKSKDILSPYPATNARELRWVIDPAAANLALDTTQQTDTSVTVGEAVRIEIIPGKVVKADCNRQFLTGEIKQEVLTGWGYPYYRFSTKGNVSSTRRACVPNTPVREAFAPAPSLTVPYNPKLPIVVYTPHGYLVHYRIWRAQPGSFVAADR